MSHSWGGRTLNFAVPIFLMLDTSLTGVRSEPYLEGPRSACFKNNMKVIDEFVEPFRKELGACNKDSDCTWWPKAGSTGIHLGEKFYYKYASCFEYAHDLAHSNCAPLSGRGTASPYSIKKIPLAYTCENRLCIPHYSNSDRTYTWRRDHGENAEKRSEIESCKNKFDKIFAPRLKIFEEKLENKK